MKIDSDDIARQLAKRQPYFAPNRLAQFAEDCEGIAQLLPPDNRERFRQMCGLVDPDVQAMAETDRVTPTPTTRRRK